MYKYIRLVAFAAFTFLSTGCENPGDVGGRFIDDADNLETKTISVGTIEEFSANSFTGRHRYVSMGIYDDPLFGKLETIGLIKPSINTAAIDSSLSPDDDFKLRLVFSSQVYGDSLSTSSFSVYRVGQIWRGNELRFGDTLPIDESEKVGEFTVTGTETVEIELSPNWIEEYNEFLSNESADRDSLYRNQFPGLAVVPDEENSKVLFARILPESGEEDSDLEFVRFVLDYPEEEENGNGDNEEENGENGEEEDLRDFQRLVDWGATMVRSEVPTEPEGLIVHSTLDKIFRISPELTKNNIGSRNIASAELVLFVDQSQLEATLPGGHIRPEPDAARINIIDSGNPGEIIFGQEPDLVGEFDDSDGSFRFNITNYVNTVLFDSPRAGQFYFSVESLNGINYSTILFGEDAPEEYRPKILITFVNTDS